MGALLFDKATRPATTVPIARTPATAAPMLLDGPLLSRMLPCTYCFGCHTQENLEYNLFHAVMELQKAPWVRRLWKCSCQCQQKVHLYCKNIGLPRAVLLRVPSCLQRCAELVQQQRGAQ